MRWQLLKYGLDPTAPLKAAVFMHTPPKNLYAVLGVAPDADAATLTSAYQQAIRLNSDISDEREKVARLAQIDDAYALLSNPVRRGVYDASLASGGARQIEAGINHPPPAHDRSSPSAHLALGNNEGLLTSVDPGKVRLWRKAVMLALVILLPLFYLYRQANVLRMQGEWQQSMEQSEQHDTQQQRSRSHELQEINQLNMRRAEINDRLQYLGQVDAADNTVSEAMEYDRLTEEKRTLEARLADLQKKYAPRY